MKLEEYDIFDQNERYMSSEKNQLFIDITIINENSESNHLILHTVGVHGVEGFAGSAVQNSMLDLFWNLNINDTKRLNSYFPHKKYVEDMIFNKKTGLLFGSRKFFPSKYILKCKI